MATISLSTSILGVLATEGKPLKLAEVYKKIENRNVSKPTVYRHLQRLIAKGLVSQREEKYLLIQGGDLAIIASDLARLDKLRPLLHNAKKGFAFTVYSPKDINISFNQESLELDLVKIIEKYISKVDPDLRTIFGSEPPDKDVLKKLIGIRFVLLVSFDGTDFSTFTTRETDELAKKRKEVLRLLVETKGITINELCDKLHLNVLKIRQIIDPILTSGFAEMDESGKIRLSVEVTSND